MPLKKVQRLNFSGNYAYAPPVEEAVINTDHITSVVPTEARGQGPFVLIRFTDGSTHVCVGCPEDFV
jgi:hypothetical protein